jgi:hypothetical protein
MTATDKILSSLPLFRHSLAGEIKELQRIGSLSFAKKGDELDLKKADSFNIIVNGMFRMEPPGKSDSLFLTPGSFFGPLPFTEIRQAGRIKALVDSTLLNFNLEDMYRFFLMSFKFLRGYLKIISRIGLGFSDVGRKYAGGKSKIITVYGRSPQSGKSYLSSLIALSLKRKEKTVVLDMSVTGYSVFNFFEKKITTPLSQRSDEEKGFEGIINEWIVPVDANLDCINVVFGSKVKVNPDIVSPLLFILSREYRFIVIDCSDDDIELRNRIFALSDQIFTLVKNRKEIRSQFEIFDEHAKEGQRVYYVINERYAGSVRNFTGGFVLPDFGPGDTNGGLDRMTRLAEDEAVSYMASLITRKRRAAVFETALIPALIYGGFLNALRKTEQKFDVYYTSSYGYIILSLYLLTGTVKDFRKWIGRFFSEERLNKLLDITFPTEHVFKNNLIMKLAEEACGLSRIEMLNDVPTAVLGRDGMTERRLFSTGYLKDVVAASFCMYPLFEQVPIMGSPYNSGYPDFSVQIEDMFRIDVDETVYVSADNAHPIKFREGRLMQLFANYMGFIHDRRDGNRRNGLADHNIVLEFSEADMHPGRIMEVSEELSFKLLSEITHA